MSGKKYPGGRKMLKGIGAVFVLAGCLGIGLWYKCQFEGRIRMLKELDRSLELLCGEIDYGRGTLPVSSLCSLFRQN